MKTNSNICIIHLHSRVLSLHVSALARGEGDGGIRLDELGELADIGEHLRQYQTAASKTATKTGPNDSPPKARTRNGAEREVRAVNDDDLCYAAGTHTTLLVGILQRTRHFSDGKIPTRPRFKRFKSNLSRRIMRKKI
jgi:hypothetical protein